MTSWSLQSLTSLGWVISPSMVLSKPLLQRVIEKALSALGAMVSIASVELDIVEKGDHGWSADG